MQALVLIRCFTFLVMTKRLYTKESIGVCPSVGPSVGQKVRDAFVFQPSRSDLWPYVTVQESAAFGFH